MPSKNQKYPGCWYCDNIVDYPNMFGLLHLGFPRCIILVRNMKDFLYSDYDEFRENIADIQWLDPAENWSAAPREEVIIKLWNFSIEQERLEEEIYNDELIDLNTEPI